MDAEGQRLEGVIGPYEENSNLLLICEAEGGELYACVLVCAIKDNEGLFEKERLQYIV